MPDTVVRPRPRTVSAGVVAHDLRSAAVAQAALAAQPGLEVVGSALNVGTLLHRTGPLKAVALEVPPVDDVDVMLLATCLLATGAAVVCFTLADADVPQRNQLVAAGIALVGVAQLPRELLMSALLPLPQSPAWPGARLW